VGSILDSLAAQRALAEARSEVISAHADWFVAAARLARATGTLGPEATATGEGSP
jgi:outer membrane protein TolC